MGVLDKNMEIALNLISWYEDNHKLYGNTLDVFGNRTLLCTNIQNELTYLNDIHPEYYQQLADAVEHRDKEAMQTTIENLKVVAGLLEALCTFAKIVFHLLSINLPS